MSFIRKKVIVISAISLSSLVVIGIGAGIGISTKNNQSSNIETPNHKEENPINLKQLSSNINESSVVIHPYKVLANTLLTKANNSIDYSKTLDKSTLFSFDIKKEQLALKEELLNKEVEYEIQIDQQKNSVRLLNNGELNIAIELKYKNQKEVKFLKLTNFKKSDHQLINLLEESDHETLNITSSDKRAYINIEGLNKNVILHKFDSLQTSDPSSNLVNDAQNLKEDKTTGLNIWFNENSDLKGPKNVRLEGKVKLDSLLKSSDNKSVLFKLVAIDKTTPLKLVLFNNNNEPISYALVDSITTTNILASHIRLVPNLTNISQTTSYAKELVKNDETNYLKADKSNDNLNKHIYVNLKKDAQNIEDKLFIEPYLITQALEQNKNILGFNIQLSFGSDKNAKIFDTANGYDLEQLKLGEFNFGIYIKKLAEQDKYLKAEKITAESNKLSSYFTRNNYESPTKQKIATQSSEPKKVEGEYYLNLVNKDQIKNPLIASLSNVNNNTDLALVQKQNDQNLIAFVDYSYLGMEQNEVLFTNSLSLIHIAKTTS